MNTEFHPSDIVDCIHNNFVFTYYPTTIFLEESISILTEHDVVQPEVVIYELSIFNNMLSSDVRFNKYIFEVLFMYLSHETVDEDIELIIDEIDGNVFKSLVESDIYLKYRPMLTERLLSFLIKQLTNLFHRPGYDIVVVGWERNMRNLAVGVVYV